MDLKQKIIDSLSVQKLKEENQEIETAIDTTLPEVAPEGVMQLNLASKNTADDGDSARKVTFKSPNAASKEKAMLKTKLFFETNTLLDFDEYKQYIDALLDYYVSTQTTIFNTVNGKDWKGRKNAFFFRDRNQIIQETIENIIVAKCVIGMLNNEKDKGQLKLDEFVYFSKSDVNYLPNSHIMSRALAYIDALKSIGLFEAEQFTAYAVSAKVVNENVDDKKANLSLKILDTERLNQIGSDYHFLSATYARILIYILNKVISFGEMTEIKTGTIADRMLLHFRKLRLVFKNYYTKKTKGRCLRITSLLKGTAKNFFRRSTLKEIYKSDAYLDYLKSDEMYISDEIYQKMETECNNKKGFLTRKRCHRLIKAVKNFDKYVNTRTCEPKRSTRSIGGKKNKYRKTKKRGGGVHDDRESAKGTKALFYLTGSLAFTAGICLLLYSAYLASNGDVSGILFAKIGGSIVGFSALCAFLGERNAKMSEKLQEEISALSVKVEAEDTKREEARKIRLHSAFLTTNGWDLANGEWSNSDLHIKGDMEFALANINKTAFDANDKKKKKNEARKIEEEDERNKKEEETKKQTFLEKNKWVNKRNSNLWYKTGVSDPISLEDAYNKASISTDL
jgi:hypothetical protein